jgi:hypothetical protein
MNPTTAVTGELTVVGGTERDQANVGWAVNRIRRAGLQLPPLVIELHPTDDGCNGHDGLFRGGSLIISVCTPNRYIIIHELAHAWEHQNLSDEIRQEFMEMWGLTTWNDHGVAWKDRGVEAVAEIITWGLYDHDLTADHSIKLQKERAFKLITGLQPRRHQQITGDSIGKRATQDPVDERPGWDELR